MYIMVKVGINGFGRIGRCFFKIAQRYKDEIQIVGINDIGTPKQMAHLLKYDSMYGVMKNKVTYDDANIYVDGERFPLFQEHDVKRWTGIAWVQKSLSNRLVSMLDGAQQALRIAFL